MAFHEIIFLITALLVFGTPFILAFRTHSKNQEGGIKAFFISLLVNVVITFVALFVLNIIANIFFYAGQLATAGYDRSTPGSNLAILLMIYDIAFFIVYSLIISAD